MIRSYRAAVVVAVAVVAVGGASARPSSSTHDIAWYEAHPDARTTLLKKCRSDHVFDRSADCANASAAETNAWGQAAARRFYSTPFPRIGSR